MPDGRTNAASAARAAALKGRGCWSFVLQELQCQARMTLGILVAGLGNLLDSPDPHHVEEEALRRNRAVDAFFIEAAANTTRGLFSTLILRA
jgi:hypothetical protein